MELETRYYIEICLQRVGLWANSWFLFPSIKDPKITGVEQFESHFANNLVLELHLGTWNINCVGGYKSIAWQYLNIHRNYFWCNLIAPQGLELGTLSSCVGQLVLKKHNKTNLEPGLVWKFHHCKAILGSNKPH